MQSNLTIEQPALFDVDQMLLTAELEKELDRALCRRYFAGWTRSGSLRTDIVVDGITFDQFQAAADRLAVSATSTTP